MKDIIFHPLKLKHKSPYGAVELGSPFHLSFSIFRYYDIRQAYILLCKDGEEEVRYPMHWSGLDNGYDTFSGDVNIESTGLYFYSFEVHSPSGTFRIGEGECGAGTWCSPHKWALIVYERKFAVPEFMKRGVMYQIFPDRFYIGGKANKAKTYATYHTNWSDVPNYLPTRGEVLNNDFFGGNLNGITEKLDYLKQLNVSVIYLNPIFEAYSNHKYDTADYLKIDPDFGTEQDFARLISEAKKRGMEIVIDGVFNHTGSDSVYFNKSGRYNTIGAYQSMSSPYYSWYTFFDHPNKYESWWGISTLPSVREENPSFDSFINGKGGVLDKWMSMGIGGVRLDVVDEIPDNFLNNLVERVKSVREDAVVIGEVWESAATKTAYSVRRSYLHGGQLDSVMNYPFRKGIFAFVKNGDSMALCNAISTVCAVYPKEVANCLMNLLGTHDTERVLTAMDYSGEHLNKNQRATAKIPKERMQNALDRLRLCAALEYTLTGVPCIYYGDEVGVEGFEDPFCRRTYPWGRENKELLEFYIQLGNLRNHSALQEGNIDVLEQGKGWILFKRYTEDSAVYVLANATLPTLSLTLDGNFTNLLTSTPLPKSITLQKNSFLIFA